MAHIYISHGIHSEFLNAVVFFHEIVASNSRMFFALFQNILFAVCIIPLLITEAFMYRFYKKWIGGYNGDCAGAVQQITEIVFYLSLLLLWKYI